MWCRKCAQDVPGVPSLEEGKYTCARCSGPLEAISAAGTPHSRRKKAERAGITGTAAHHRPDYDGWEMEEQLRHAFRVLGPARSARRNRTSPKGGTKFRVDAGQGVPGPHVKRARRATRRVDRAVAVEDSPRSTSLGDRLVGFVVWSSLSFGTMAVVCGLALLGWSAHTGQQELWAIGAPIILGAQVALVLGLVLQLDRIWRDSRRAAARLQTVDEQIHELKTTTSLLGTTHGPSTAFYAHWAGGAGPDVLLSDLKSQLDLLAVKLAKE
ncbi:MAG TPA: hypothetical protein VGZ26_11695 [Pirellulales bacterium]|jgi:hypothetical protein|nr:hypothetical protein [Pirellulales bacterium]